MSIEFWVIVGAITLISLQNCILVWLVYSQHRQLINWIDSLGEMTGDLLLGIQEAIDKKEG